MLNPQKQARKNVLARHLQRLEARLSHLNLLDRRYVLARVIVVVVGGAGSLLAAFWGTGRSGLIVLVASIVVFAGVVFLRRRVDRSRMRFRFARSLVASQLARMSLDWEHIPVPQAIPVEPDHPFAADLDILGERSLHRLLDTATSHGGNQRLASWLLATTPNLDDIHRRQAILRELLPLSGFRRRLALNGLFVKETSRGLWDGEKLLRWLGQRPASRAMRPVLFALLFIAAANLVLFSLNFLAFLPPFWVIGLALYGVIYALAYREYESLWDDATTLGEALDQLRAVLVYLEKYPFLPGGQLDRLCAPFRQAGRRPSPYLRRIVGLISAAGLGNNQLVSFAINLIIPWNLIFAALLERYKKTLRAALPGWLDTWYELEALNSLANFAYLNPGSVFPLVQDGIAPDRLVFEAQGLGHPLIPDDMRVCNDFTIGQRGEIAIVTGSNMSGKSTFLRTLGVNLCLAYAGGAVLAARMSVIPFRLFTCIQVSDSLSNGISYFYAEVRRLKALLDALGMESPFPVFYLVDEIFRGTNNRERRIGSRAFVRALVSASGTGVVSTHDLELVHLADELPGIRNFHFREDIRDNRMIFDYSLRPGPCPTTNALRIMALEGLPVEAGD